MSLRRSVLALVFAVLASSSARAQTVDRVFLVEPSDGGVVGPRPKLQVGIEGTDLGKVRFKIELSRDSFETIAHTFDQLEEPGGWLFTALNGENGGMLWVQKPLSDGVYAWRASAWNGVDWVRGRDTRRLVVDSVPPADVTGLRMRVDPKDRAILLDWDPVVSDRNGHGEAVSKYHVYRYDLRSFFFSIRAFEIGETPGTSFRDDSRRVSDVPLLFYKVAAEDAAGNEPDRRY